MGQIRKIQIPRMLNFWSWKITSIRRLHCNIGSFDDDGDIVKVSCKPLGHPDGEAYPSEEIVQQFFKEVSVSAYWRHLGGKASALWTPTPSSSKETALLCRHSCPKIKTIKGEVSQSKVDVEGLVAVHCTHGLNR